MRKATILLFVMCVAAAVILGGSNAPKTAAVYATSTISNGFVNLYDKNATDKTAYGQVIDVTQWHNNVGWVWDNLDTINGQTSYTSGYIDIRGYSYFTTNNDKNFEIICYNANKEPIAWIAENSSAKRFRDGESTSIIILLSLPTPSGTYQNTINNKTVISIDPNSQFGGSTSGGGGGIWLASIDTTKQIAYVRVAFANNEPDPYFRAFTDDFQMLIKLNRDDASGGVMNALMIDIYDGVFNGFNLTAFDLDFEVGTIIKNTSKEIIFSVPTIELWFYYTATNGGWQNVLTGMQYFSHYGNETITLNTPTYIAQSPYTQDLASIEDGGNNLPADNDTNNTNIDNTTIFNGLTFTHIFAILGGVLILAVIGSFIKRGNR
jgi:hypothetical protein